VKKNEVVGIFKRGKQAIRNEAMRSIKRKKNGKA
jgi:hypothetical protein